MYFRKRKYFEEEPFNTVTGYRHFVVSDSNSLAFSNLNSM
jgi:hypothetical protein